MRRVTPTLLLCAAILCLAIPQALFAQATTPPATATPPATQPIVREVQVQGYQQVSDEVRNQVQALIDPLEGQPYDQTAVDTAVTAIENLGWFFSAAARQAPVADGVNIIFTVVENPVLTSIEITGNVSFTTEELLAVMKSKPGDVLNQNQLRDDLLAINAKYVDAGYLYSGLRQEPELRTGATPGTATLTIPISEPVISEIRITSNTRTREYVIRRELAFRVGEVYNLNKVRESSSNLLRLGIFDSVRIPQPEPGIIPGTLLMTVDVTERRTGTAGIGIAQNNVEGWTGFVTLSEANLFGTGQSLSLNVRFGAEESYQISYLMPWIDRHHTSFSASIYNRSILREAFNGNAVPPDPQFFDYTEKRTGFNFRFGRPIGGYSRMYLGFRADTISGEPDSSTTGDIPVELLEKTDVRSISLSRVFDTRGVTDSVMKPYDSWYLGLNTEYAGFGGAGFTKIWGDARRYMTVREYRNSETGESEPTRNWVWASRLMAGGSVGVPPFLDQYMLGGADTLRGYKDGRFPGANMVLLNTELRVPITESVDIVGFTDIGDAWGGRFANIFGDPDFKLRYDYGIGVRLLLPALGPLRLDYAINDEGGSEITFGIGATF